MRLAIVGSQAFTETWKVTVAENLIRSFIGSMEADIEQIISGGCSTGVDAMAYRIADWYGFDEDCGDLLIHRPEKHQWAPNGFEERNSRIARDCTHLLCIRDSESKTYGSGWTADRAERFGKHVWRFVL